MTGVDTIGGNYTTYANQYKQQNIVPQATVVQPLGTDTFTRENGNTVDMVNIPTQQYTKKSHPLRSIFFGLLATGAVASGIAMHMGGGIRNAFKNKEVISTTKKGFEKIKNQITGKVKKTIIENNNEVVPKPQTSKFTVTKQGDISTCTIPGKVNDSSKFLQSSVTSQAKKLGIATTSNTVPKDAVVDSYSFTYETFFGLKKYKVTVKNGEVVSARNLKKRTATVGDYTLQNIKAYVKNAPKDKKANLKNYRIQSYTISENGVKSQYQFNTDCYKLSSFATNRFTLDSDEVIAYASQNPEVKALLEAIKRDEKNLNIVSGEIKCHLGTVKMENGKIAGIVEHGIYYPNTDSHFIALQEKNKKLFNNILENKYKYRTATYSV